MTTSLTRGLAALLTATTFLPVASADIPSPYAKNAPLLMPWTENATATNGTMLVLGAAVVIAIVAVAGLWALRRRGAKA